MGKSSKLKSRWPQNRRIDSEQAGVLEVCHNGARMVWFHLQTTSETSSRRDALALMDGARVGSCDYLASRASNSDVDASGEKIDDASSGVSDIFK